jgi:hypothetical protein
MPVVVLTSSSVAIEEPLPAYLFRPGQRRGNRFVATVAEFRMKAGSPAKSFKSGPFSAVFLDLRPMAAISPTAGAGRFSRRLFLRGFSRG